MRTTINHALDIIEHEAPGCSPDQVSELMRVIHRVQADYAEIIENALSLLVQRKTGKKALFDTLINFETHQTGDQSCHDVTRSG